MNNPPETQTRHWSLLLLIISLLFLALWLSQTAFYWELGFNKPSLKSLINLDLLAIIGLIIILFLLAEAILILLIVSKKIYNKWIKRGKIWSFISLLGGVIALIISFALFPKNAGLGGLAYILIIMLILFAIGLAFIIGGIFFAIGYLKRDELNLP